MTRDAPGPELSPVGYVSDAAAIAQTVYDLIQAARSSIVLQMYMLAGNGETEALRALPGAFPYAHTVVDWLLERKRRCPELHIVVILDTQTLDQPRLTRNRRGPLARQRLADAGIPVLHANLFGNTFDPQRRFPKGARFHTQDPKQTPVEEWGRAQQRWQTWHNLEDHRKNLVIDEGAWGAVTSHNFLDVSSTWHENLFLLGAPAAGALWEQVRSALSSALDLPQRLDESARQRVRALAALPACPESLPLPQTLPQAVLRALGNPGARGSLAPAPVEVLGTRAIRPQLVEALAAAGPGDRVCAASAWFSDEALLLDFAAAADRGADVQILVDDLAALSLDPIPAWFVRALANLRVIEQARARLRPGFELRIHPSAAGSMMHLKTAAFIGRRSFLIGGQANYTPNSFSGAWLETGLRIEGAESVQAFLSQFTERWEAAHPPAAGNTFSRLMRLFFLWLIEQTIFRF